MTGLKSYGQFCPVAMSAELLCSRWTLLIVRELLSGSSSFNDIRRGIPLISRTLLSSRLKELEAAGLLLRVPVGQNGRRAYRPTAAGEALETVVSALGDWGQEWIEPELALGEINYGYLLWNLRRTVQRVADMPRRFVARFSFTDAPEDNRHHWLLFDGEDIDICHVDPGFEVNVWIECRLRTMAELWMGWKSLSSAVDDDGFIIDGPPEFTNRPFRWLGQSRHAGLPKQPQEARVTVG